jgi:diguanylate cyclase (GGDEF)-like protein
MLHSIDLPQDQLTGFLKRPAFLGEFTRLLADARSEPLEKPFSLALFDIDNFLLVNQNYGHVGGDAVLAKVAEIMRQELDSGAILARYGGDEFAALLPNVEREQAFLAMERVRVAISRCEVKEDGQVISGISTSGGVASFPNDGRTEAELLRKADQALYRAKASGRGQIRLAYEERMVPKTAHFTQTQLERLAQLAELHGVSEADLLREAVDELLTKYGVNRIES